MNQPNEELTEITSKEKSNYFIRLFRGDISLPITYWVYGVGFSLLFRLGNYLIENNFIDIVIYEHGVLLIKSYNVLALIVNIFLSIAIWRSASKYVQSPGWANVAKVIVILRLIFIVKLLYLQYFTDTEVAIKNEILLTNKSLPMMVDETTRFDRMSFNESNIHYHYTIIDIEKSQIDASYFKVMMHKAITESSCNDDVMLELLKEDRKLIFEYNDKNNEFVSDVTIELYNCN